MRAHRAQRRRFLHLTTTLADAIARGWWHDPVAGRGAEATPGRRLTLPFRCERQKAEEEVLPIEATLQALPSASQDEAGLR